MLLRISLLKGTHVKQSKKESVCMSPTLAVLSIIEFQTIRGVLRKKGSH